MKEYNIQIKGIELTVYQNDDGLFEIPTLIKELQKVGTSLKPAYEPVIVARKPCEGSTTDNVIKYGVGGINIDECRIGVEEIGGGTVPSFRDVGKKSKENIGIARLSFGQVRNAERIKYDSHIGRFPSNLILTYDETDKDEVCSGFPNTSGGKMNLNSEVKRKGMSADGSSFNSNTCGFDVNKGTGLCHYGDEGSASRYFKNCEYNIRDDDIWKHLFVNNVENNFKILRATRDSIAQMNVEGLLKELLDRYARSVGSQSNLTETSIAQDIVEMLTWDFKIETSRVMQDFITNYNKCTLLQNLVQFAEKWDSTDTTQTTQNLLKLFGYVKVAITNYILGNVELDQSRYMYAPKASKRDRDCDGTIRNIHPTCKPCDLMQYLVRLVTPNGGTVLDPFNGSGSTGKAVMYENKDHNKNYKYIGIELTDEYLPISKARIDYAIGDTTDYSVENIAPEKKTKENDYYDIWDELE